MNRLYFFYGSRSNKPFLARRYPCPGWSLCLPYTCGSTGSILSALPDTSFKKDVNVAERWLLVCGILSSLLYACNDTLAGTLWKGYSFTSQGFSELLAPGSPVRQLSLVLAIVYSVLLLAFTWGVWMSARNRALRVVAVMLLLQAVDGLVTPAFFPAPMRGMVGAESAGMIHVILTAVGVLTILLVIVFGAIAYRSWFRYYSIGTLLIVLLFGIIGFSYVPALSANLPTPWLGVTERVNIYGWMLWVAVLAITLLRAQMPTIKNSGIPGKKK